MANDQGSERPLQFLRAPIRPELSLINRVDEIVYFNKLSE